MSAKKGKERRMSVIDAETFRKKFFELDVEFRPSQIDAVFDCLGNSEIVGEVIIPIQCKDCRYRMHNGTCTKVMKRKPDNGYCDEGKVKEV